MGLCLWALAWGGKERRYLASQNLTSSASEVAFDCQDRTESKGPPSPSLPGQQGIEVAEAFQGRGSGVYKGEGWGKLPGEEAACPFRKGRVQVPFLGPWQPPQPLVPGSPGSQLPAPGATLCFSSAPTRWQPPAWPVPKGNLRLGWGWCGGAALPLLMGAIVTR